MGYLIHLDMNREKTFTKRWAFFLALLPKKVAMNVTCAVIARMLQQNCAWIGNPHQSSQRGKHALGFVGLLTATDDHLRRVLLPPPSHPPLIHEVLLTTDCYSIQKMFFLGDVSC